MGMRGIWKIHGAHNTWCAQQQYADVCALAVILNRGDLIKADVSGYGWRKLDKLSVKILAALGTDWSGLCAWHDSGYAIW